MDTRLVTEWAQMNHKKRDLEVEIDDLKEDMAKLEAQIVEEMGVDGVTQVKLDNGLGVVYLHTDYFPKNLTEDPEMKLAAVKMAFPDIIEEGYNAMRFKGIIREIAKEGGDLPTPLVGVIEVVEKFTLRNRKR